MVFSDQWGEIVQLSLPRTLNETESLWICSSVQSGRAHVSGDSINGFQRSLIGKCYLVKCGEAGSLTMRSWRADQSIYFKNKTY